MDSYSGQNQLNVFFLVNVEFYCFGIECHVTKYQLKAAALM